MLPEKGKQFKRDYCTLTSPTVKMRVKYERKKIERGSPLTSDVNFHVDIIAQRK